MTEDLHTKLSAKVKDPAIRHFMSETFKVAKDSGASKAVIDSIQKGLELSYLRLKYEEDHTTPESATCQRIKTDTFNNDWDKVYKEGKTALHIADYQMSNRTENQFLKSFVSAIGAKRILEVGMYTGFTCTGMIEALPEDGKLTTVDINEYLKQFALTRLEQSPHKHKIDIIIEPAISAMKNMIKQGRQFDLAFLDSDEKEYTAYVKLLIDENLLAPKGTILVDNAFMYGDSYVHPASEGDKFAKGLISNPKLHVVLLPIKDGIFMIRRRSDVDGGIC